MKQPGASAQQNLLSLVVAMRKFIVINSLSKEYLLCVRNLCISQNFLCMEGQK